MSRGRVADAVGKSSPSVEVRIIDMESATGGADTFGVEQIAEIGVWMRVYLPLTFGQLRSAVAAGTVSAPRIGFAVTPALREWYVSGDAEALEYAAMTDAAAESLRLLAADPDSPARRVVVAADVADGSVRLTPDRHPAALVVSAAVPIADVASVHVDDPAAAADITLAAVAVAGAQAGDPDAASVVAGAEDHELQWYAVQELTDLLAD
jgi:hypothetical protein